MTKELTVGQHSAISKVIYELSDSSGGSDFIQKIPLGGKRRITPWFSTRMIGMLC